MHCIFNPLYFTTLDTLLLAVSSLATIFLCCPRARISHRWPSSRWSQISPLAAQNMSKYTLLTVIYISNDIPMHYFQFGSISRPFFPDAGMLTLSCLPFQQRYQPTYKEYVHDFIIISITIYMSFIINTQTYVIFTQSVTADQHHSIRYGKLTLHYDSMWL